MITKRFTLPGSLPAVLWLPDGEVTQVLQITHGMTEHMGRYAFLAEELTQAGIAVAGFDLRGHGQNSGDNQVAAFAQGDWENSLQDMRELFLLLQQQLPGVPHVMLGFSLGSFLLRDYLSLWSDGVAAAAILGTGQQPKWLLEIMGAIVHTQVKKVGFEKTTQLVRQLSFGAYNQKFRPNRTHADWLCSDNATLDSYLEDPLVRQDISSGLFWQLLQAMKGLINPEKYARWNRNMPILLLSGACDAVGDMGKGVRMLETQLFQAGIRNVTTHVLPKEMHIVLYPGARGCQILKKWLQGMHKEV